MSFVPGREPLDGALEKATRLLYGSSPVTVAVFPTGPVGHSRKYHVGCGIGHLAVHCPCVPIVPITVLGLQNFRIQDILMLKRPSLTVSVGEPFRGSDLVTDSDETRDKMACERVRMEWDRLEKKSTALEDGP